MATKANHGTDGNDCFPCPGGKVYCPGCQIQNNDNGGDTCPGPCGNNAYGTMDGQCKCPKSK